MAGHSGVKIACVVKPVSAANGGKNSYEATLWRFCSVDYKEDSLLLCVSLELKNTSST